MGKPRHNPKAPARRGSRGQLRGEPLETPNEEIHGRGGEPLDYREKPRVGNDDQWERSQDSDITPLSNNERADAKVNRVIEIDYEQGLGSRFQVEGRGGIRRNGGRKGV